MLRANPNNIQQQWESKFTQIFGTGESSLHDFLKGVGWPQEDHIYSKPTSIPDYQREWVNQVEHNYGEGVIEIQKELDSSDPWPKQPITETLTPEQKKVLERYNTLHLNLVPDNWQELFANLQKRPDITNEQYQKLLNNQEKHQESDLEKHKLEDLKPSDLPPNWKVQVAERDKWVSLFPNLTPEQVKAKYDEPTGIQLTDKQKEAINNYQKIKEQLEKWTNKFPNKTPDQVVANQGASSAEADNLRQQIQRLETLLRGRNSRNINVDSDHKKENKVCEICNQIKYEVFKYSRISARGFNTYHAYRICSFCQKVVQMVTDNNNINPEKIYS